MKNEQGKMRKVNEPYAVYRNENGWEWRVLKCWQSPDKEKSNPYARWMCAVKSPFTAPGYDMGDVYIREVLSQGIKIENPILEKW